MVATSKGVTINWQPHLPSGHWLCDGCHMVFYIIDEIPRIEEQVERVEVTAFGDPQRQYLINKIKKLYCSSCA